MNTSRFRRGTPRYDLPWIKQAIDAFSEIVIEHDGKSNTPRNHEILKRCRVEYPRTLKRIHEHGHYLKKSEVLMPNIWHALCILEGAMHDRDSDGSITNLSLIYQAARAEYFATSDMLFEEMQGDP